MAQNPVPGMQPQQTMDYAWANVVSQVLSLPAHYDISVPKCGYVHPLQAGFVAHVGEPKGQIANYRMTVSDGRGVHVLEFQDSYWVHWDKVDPLTNPIGHIAEDAPHWGSVLGVLAVAGVIGVLIWLDSQS